MRGTLRVAAPVAFGALHLGGAVARFLEAHPQVEVEVQLSDRYVDLLDAGVDVAVRIGRLPDSDLVARRLAPCRMAIAAAPAWLARHGTPRHPAELRQAPRLTFSEAVSAGDWTLADANGTVEIVSGPSRLAANNVQMLLAAAREGAGVVFGPSFVLGEAIARGELVELLPDWRAPDLTIQAVYPSARHLPLKVRRFVDCLATEFGDAPPWDRYREPTGQPRRRTSPRRG